MEKIINDIIQAFSSLWKIRKRGDSWEIITPVSTSNDGFVSVFLTVRGDEYIVTDGGWVDSGVYDIDDISGMTYKKILNYYIETYHIKTVKGHNVDYYYKKVSNPIYIPNLVFDVSAFIGGLVSTSCAEIAQTTDKSYNIFTKKAHTYLRTFIPNECFLSKKEIKEAFPTLSFGAAIKSCNGVALLNFATGSSDNYYINSLCKSQTSFQIAKKLDINCKIANRILLIDDQKNSLTSDKVGMIVRFIREEGICDIENWSNRNALKERLVV